MKREAMWGGGIRRLRVRKKISQEALAEQIDMAQKTVSRIECGGSWNEDTYAKIRTALAVDDVEVAYEAGIARQVTDAVTFCEKEGLPLIRIVLGELPPKRTAEERKDGGLPAAVVTCAETLERELLSAIDETHLTGALVPTLRKFIPGPEGTPLTASQSHALVRLIGALVAGLLEPCSLNLETPDSVTLLIDVQDVGEGWLLQLVFNAHRGKAVTLSFDASGEPPTLATPECAVQIPVHDSATDRRRADRKMLVSAHRVLKPAYALTDEWLDEGDESLDRLDFTTAFLATDEAAHGRKDDDNAPIAYLTGDDRRRQYLRSLTKKGRVPSLPVIDKRYAKGSKVLRDGVDEARLERFVRQCLQAIKEASSDRELEEIVDEIIDEWGPDRLIGALREGLREHPDREDVVKLVQALDGVEKSPDKRASLRDVLKRVWDRTGEFAGHVRTADTLWEKASEIMGIPGVGA